MAIEFRIVCLITHVISYADYYVSRVNMYMGMTFI